MLTLEIQFNSFQQFNFFSASVGLSSTEKQSATFVTLPHLILHWLKSPVKLNTTHLPFKQGLSRVQQR